MNSILVEFVMMKPNIWQNLIASLATELTGTRSKKSNALIAHSFKNHRKNAKNVILFSQVTFARYVICMIMNISKSSCFTASIAVFVEVEDRKISFIVRNVNVVFQSTKREIILAFKAN